jgi:hypothetical protein
MSLGFLDHMRVVFDHRIPGMVTYPLDEVLLATLVGVVCGADDWEGVEEVSAGALEWLRGFLSFWSHRPSFLGPSGTMRLFFAHSDGFTGTGGRSASAKA